MKNVQNVTRTDFWGYMKGGMSLKRCSDEITVDSSVMPGKQNRKEWCDLTDDNDVGDKRWDTVIFHLPLFRTSQRTSAGPGAAAGACPSSCQDDGTRGGRRRRRTKTTTAAGTRGRRRRRRRRCGTHLQLPEMQCSI